VTHFDHGATDHPPERLAQTALVGVVGGHVLEMAGGGVEAETPGGIDVAEPHGVSCGEPSACSGQVDELGGGQHGTHRHIIPAPPVPRRRMVREAGCVSDHVEIQIPCGSAEEAAAMATVLVEAHLAACVQAVPVQSVYLWNGETARDDEVLLLVKTRADRFDVIERWVHQHHSYELPAITMVPMAGSAAYLQWIDDQLATDS
jgi:periplasmic divalent cation tolerance protein